MKILSWLTFVISLFIFSSVFISPANFPYAGLLPFLIPVALGFNLVLFFVLALAWKKWALFPLITLLIGYKFFLISFQFNQKDDSTEGLEVLTYNVHLFNYQNRLTAQNDPNVFSWLADHPADIKALQEFYQDFTVESRNAIKILGKNGDYEHAYHIVDGNMRKRSYGLAIFSKYPILNDGVVFDNKSSNGAMFADIRVGKDTIRVYNVHLESMAIQAEALETYDQAKQVYRQTLGKLHRGSIKRNEQLTILFEHLSNSPHPVILMGDLNEIPYSYAYFKLSQKLKNAFEIAGRGFGFTYNRVLFFLRIDHVFSSPEIKPVYFNTHREVDYSDHYPVSARFTWDGIEL